MSALRRIVLPTLTRLRPFPPSFAVHARASCREAEAEMSFDGFQINCKLGSIAHDLLSTMGDQSAGIDAQRTIGLRLRLEWLGDASRSAWHEPPGHGNSPPSTVLPATLWLDPSPMLAAASRRQRGARAELKSSQGEALRALLQEGELGAEGFRCTAKISALAEFSDQLFAMPPGADARGSTSAEGVLDCALVIEVVSHSGGLGSGESTQETLAFIRAPCSIKPFIHVRILVSPVT